MLNTTICDFKISPITFKAPHGSTPSEVSELLLPCQPEPQVLKQDSD